MISGRSAIVRNMLGILPRSLWKRSSVSRASGAASSGPSGRIRGFAISLFSLSHTSRTSCSNAPDRPVPQASPQHGASGANDNTRKIAPAHSSILETALSGWMNAATRNDFRATPSRMRRVRLGVWQGGQFRWNIQALLEAAIDGAGARSDTPVDIVADPFDEEQLIAASLHARLKCQRRIIGGMLECDIERDGHLRACSMCE